MAFKAKLEPHQGVRHTLPLVPVIQIIVGSANVIGSPEHFDKGGTFPSLCFGYILLYDKFRLLPSCSFFFLSYAALESTSNI